MSRVYAAILAGGSGSRMGNSEKPKQFWDLAGKPVLVHTVEKFCLVGEFDAVIVLVPESWVNRVVDILNRALPSFEGKIAVIAGGDDRNATIMNAIDYIDGLGELDDETILVTHDAVRPFVTFRIIEENIAAVREYGACDTVIPATDTIVQSDDGTFVTSIPVRSQFYQGQTPQSFKAKRLRDLFAAMDDAEKATLTDACKILAIHGDAIALVRGDVSNIKLTYTDDMRVARAMMEDAATDAARGAVDA